MQTANVFLPVERLQLRPSAVEQSSKRAAQHSAANVRAQIEHRLWKVCRETVSPKVGIVELLAFLFFGAIAIAVTAYSSSELFHLLGGDALEHTVRTLITR